MSQSTIKLANDTRLASEQQTRGSFLVDFQEVATVPLGEQPLPLCKYFSNSSSVEMGVDGSVTPVDFDVTPGDASIYRVESLVLVMSLSANPTMEEFGDIAALTNGLSLNILDADDVSIFDVLGGQPIKSNNDFAAIGELYYLQFTSSRTLKVTITPGSPIRLEGSDGEKLRLTVSDNLSLISRMRCVALGNLESSLT